MSFAVIYSLAGDGDCPFPVVGEDGAVAAYVEVEDAPLYDTEEEARAVRERMADHYGESEGLEIVQVRLGYSFVPPVAAATA